MFRNLFYTVTIILLLSSCESKETELAWQQSFYLIGNQSSPRATDLNGDGIKDIVLGGGLEEMAPTDHGVMALNGIDGSLMWKVAATAHMVGSATFQDITNDGTPDVFIGGRNHQLYAINGATGQIIWQYERPDTTHPILKYARYNFYNSTLVPDQNQDGIPELLTINGGNWDALPNETHQRYPGVLMVLNSVNGTIIAADTMPDGKESYMAPLAYQLPNDKDTYLLFGTGGETAGGHLYHTTLEALLQQNLNHAKALVKENAHGFIAPPSLADINNDQIPEIIAVSHAAQIFAIDGQSHQVLWQQQFPGYESSNALAIGQFTGNDTPDFFAIMSHGTWPNYNHAQQVVIDGATGLIAYQDTMGCFALYSPVIYDLNHDGYDEAIFNLNQYDCSVKFPVEEFTSPPTIEYQLIALDIHHNRIQVIDRASGFKNVFSTPWIGDLDGDHYLDLVYTPNFDGGEILRFLGLNVKRISTNIRVRNAPKWGEYLGHEGRGHYPPPSIID